MLASPDALDWAKQRLAKHRRELTPSRRRLLLALRDAERPLPLLALLETMGSAGGSADRVSLFRALKSLEQCGLIHRLIFSGGYCLCRLPNEPFFHHHLICTRCGRVTEVACAKMGEVQASVAATSGFRLESLRVELLGICRDCRES